MPRCSWRLCERSLQHSSQQVLIKFAALWRKHIGCQRDLSLHYLLQNSLFPLCNEWLLKKNNLENQLGQILWNLSASKSMKVSLLWKDTTCSLEPVSNVMWSHTLSLPTVTNQLGLDYLVSRFNAHHFPTCRGTWQPSMASLSRDQSPWQPRKQRSGLLEKG